MNVKGALNCVSKKQSNKTWCYFSSSSPPCYPADLLDNDEDMINLQLTAKQRAGENNETLPMESHQDVELLLEEYARQLNSILLEIDFLLQRVQSKQDLVALSLDAFRNRMIRMNLYLSIGKIPYVLSPIFSITQLVPRCHKLGVQYSHSRILWDERPQWNGRCKRCI